ncbi:GNAT family N-acetyltransferase [Alteromonas ponticola]|uniref:GNAT family N-acetyltransferase n=1 Tax=Alteromonas aquimaris TaxID=2998417 RepID=A0ABT3P4J3_9ALTE|nr:GNAT family N-acetyltransferase [Alteromonas aquimaris]MCW8107692.1 GNAT family N-acetyltransferase [Alteromonas aquimaris]
MIQVDMALNKVCDWLFSHYSGTKNGVYHRHMLIIAMEENESLLCTNKIITRAPRKLDLCVLSDRSELSTHTKPVKLYKQLLGQSYDLAIYDAVSEFRPSAFLAVAGTVSHQGSLILVTPPLNKWPQQAVARSPFYLTHGFELPRSRYIAQLRDKFCANKHIALWQEDAVTLPEKTSFVHKVSPQSVFKSHDQEVAFDNLITFFKGENRYALVKAMRGRGKSTLLGLFSAYLQGHGYRVLVTSTARQSVEGLVQIGNGSMQTFRTNEADLKNRQSHQELTWVAPDSPLLLNNDYDVLLVDEAASFPAPVLTKICLSNKKVILSSSTDGYEGSGKGFEHRVISELGQHAQVQHIHLSEPLRWYNSDPLEEFLARSLLFKRDLSSSTRITAANSTHFHFSTSGHLSELDLSQALNLLNGAHYQTTPDDLMRLVDSPDIYFGLLKTTEGEIIAACAVNVEGGHKLASLAQAICNGSRRVKGHLSAQGLAYFCAQEELTTKLYWRVNRIAVYDRLRGHGLGSYLLNAIINKAKYCDVEAVTSSFGVNPALLKFWKKNGFHLLKVGSKKNKASGSRSALIAYPLQTRFKRLIGKLSKLGLNDAKFDDVDPAILHFFDCDHVGENELTLFYLSRWKQFCYNDRSLASLYSAIPWLINEISTGSSAPLPGTDLFLSDLEHALDNKKNAAAELEDIKRYLTSYFERQPTTSFQK